MAYPDTQFQNNPQSWGTYNPQLWQLAGLMGNSLGLGQSAFGQSAFGQGAYGQPWGQFGAQPFGQANFGALNAGYGAAGYGAPWGFQQRQLSQHEVGDVVRQLVPLLPHLIAQAQTQPQAAFGYATGYGGSGTNPWNSQGRMLTPQDVNEVVRQILPLMPQIVGALQGQGPYFAQQGQPWGIGQAFGGQQNPLGQVAPWLQGGSTQQPQFMAAFGGSPQRQLSPHDVNEIARQLVGIIPQVIGTLQAGQQRII